MQDDQQQAGWQFNPEQPTAQPGVVQQQTQQPQQQNQGQQSTGAMVSWSASEFIAYHKSAGWYIGMFLIIALLAVGAFFITNQDVLSAVSIFVLGFLLLIFAGRKPRVLNYAIEEAGVKIGDKLYPFNTLRSFAVIEESNFRSIELLPTKRLLPGVSMYYEPQDEQKIVEALGAFLPKEDKTQDLIDRFMHKIRF